MSATAEQSYRPKFVENSLLVIVGLLAHAPLYYQAERWARGYDPMFVHPNWIAQSRFPFLLQMATVHPLFWIVITVLAFMRICHNYGWRLNR